MAKLIRSSASLRTLFHAGLAAALLLPGLSPPTAAQVLAPPPPAGTAKGGVLAPASAPLSLTASDGSGLELVSLSAQAVVEDPLAFTELHLAFRNPRNRVREGRFRITLPPGATISRFAMRIGDSWQEGEVVEQHAARVAYEDFLHRRQDPALLEAEAGNEFSARVFPIPARAVKELIVSYSQELVRPGEAYRLPLYGLPRMGSLSIRALVNRPAPAKAGAPASSLGGARIAHEVVEVAKRDFKPDRDFEVMPGSGPARAGLRHDNLVVARIVPVADSDRRDDVTALHVLFDTSASRALGLGEQLAAFESLVAELRKLGDPTLTVTAFDQDVATIFTGKASAMGDAVRKKVLERRALGASDLERALGALAGVVKKDARVLLVSDGVATAGGTGADALRARVKALGAAGVGRLDVLAVGGIRDEVALGRIVTAGLARDGVVLDATQPAAALARKLTRATRSGVRLAVDGAGWVWPSVLNGIQPGDPVLVYADLPRDRPFRLTVDGAPLPMAGTLVPVERPLLERAWVRARMSRLLEQRDDALASDRDLAEALRRQVIDLSVKNRVLSPFTSLLVLETEADYARFGIERRALADILTVGAGGIALAHRTEFPAMAGAFELERLSPPEGASVIQQQSAVTAKAVADRRHAERSPTGNASSVARAAASGGRVDRPAARVPAKADVEELLSGVEAPRPRPRAVSDGRRGNSPPPREARAAAVMDFEEAPAAAPADVRQDGALMKSAPAAAPALPSPPPAIAMAAPAAAAARPLARRQALEEDAARGDGDDLRSALAAPVQSGPPSLHGELKNVIDLVQHHHAREALGKALSWRQRDPGDVLALIALGECWEALGNPGEAARAYGSIIDLFPGRADLRRFAGERLERVRGAAALALAVDTFRKAVEQRPDHPASHRLLGFALLKQGRPREAFDAIAAGIAQRYPAGRFAGVEQILAEDLGLAAAMWTRYEPGRAKDIQDRLVRAGGAVEAGRSLRFVLNWETDANDVDFHIHDSKGGHAFYSSRTLPSGGTLYADVTTGYGPECFTIRGAASAGPYRLQAHYYSRGPMGYGMGKLQAIEHDGHGKLRFEERPFVIMEDGAFVDLGQVSGSTLGGPAIVIR